MSNRCYLCGKQKTNNIILHSFPKDEAIRQNWLNACGLSARDEVSSTRICSRHFQVQDYKKNKNIGLEVKYLNREAVPSIKVALSPSSTKQNAPIMEASKSSSTHAPLLTDVGMSSTYITVKNEVDSDEALNSYRTELDDEGEWHKTPIDIKCEPAECNDNTEATTATHDADIKLKSEPLQEQEVFEEQVATTNADGGFVIYELEDPLRPTTGTTQKVTTTTANKPRIINTKLREKRSFSNSTTNSARPAKKIALETLFEEALAPTTKPTNTTPVLKVKCLCRLGNMKLKSTKELKKYFEEMFEDTRKLSRAEQRNVKMALLEAITDAEHHVDAGRNCEKCCINF